MEKSNFSAVKTERIYEKIVRQVVDLIKEGKLKPGDRLPAERQLAVTLDCSRTSLREACRVLESEGLIVSKPGGGRFIQKVDEKFEPSYEFDNVNLIEKTAVLHFLEVREALEPKIVELACQRATAEDIERIERVFINTNESMKHPESRVDGDTSFHLAIAEATHNFVFVSIMRSNLNLVRQVKIQTLLSEERYKDAVNEHRQIVEAIKKGDVPEAIEVTLNHIRKIREQLLLENKR